MVSQLTRRGEKSGWLNSAEMILLLPNNSTAKNYVRYVVFVYEKCKYKQIMWKKGKKIKRMECWCTVKVSLLNLSLLSECQKKFFDLQLQKFFLLVFNKFNILCIWVVLILCTQLLLYMYFIVCVYLKPSWQLWKVNYHRFAGTFWGRPVCQDQKGQDKVESRSYSYHLRTSPHVDKEDGPCTTIHNWTFKKKVHICRTQL